MTIPFSHLASALISPALHAWANTIDNLFSERYQNQVTFLIAISKLFQLLLILPLYIWLQPSLSVPGPLVWLLVAGAVIDFVYVYPYFWALAHTDTSVVAALFSIGKIILPVLTWLLLGEQLNPLQYAGFFLIILAGLMLTFDWRKFHLNRAALYMLLSSLLLSIGAIMEKYVLMQGVAWESVTMLTMLIECGIGMALLLARPRLSWMLWRVASARTKGLFAGEAMLSMIGNAGSVFAMSLLPLSILKAISSTQHLFIALYARLFHRALPGYFKESSTHLSPALKIAGLLLTVLGTALAAGYVRL